MLSYVYEFYTSSKSEVTAAMGRPKHTLSNSRLNTASECEYKYFIRYEKRIYGTIKSSFFIVGSLVHDVIDWFYQHPENMELSEDDQVSVCLDRLYLMWTNQFDQRMVSELRSYQSSLSIALIDTASKGASKRPLTTKYWKDNFKEYFDARIKQINRDTEVRFPEIKWRKPIGILFPDSITCIQNFIAMHRSVGLPKELLTEYNIYPAVEVFGRPKDGRIDRVEIQGNEEIDVYDYKTGAGQWDVTKVANEDQLNWYAYAISKKFGKMPSHIGIWNLLQGKIIKHKLEPEDIERFLARLQAKVQRANELDAKMAGKLEEELTFVVPAGRNSDVCKSCDLAVDPNPEVRCKFYKIYDK